VVEHWGTEHGGQISKFSSDGTYITQVTDINNPISIAVDSSGNIYVVEQGENRVLKYDSGLAFVTSWGSYGSGDLNFDIPWGITVDSGNNVYVADNNNQKIKKFDSNGNFLASYGGFTYPNDIAQGTDGNFFVADYGAYVIHRCDASMTVLDSFGEGGTAGPELINGALGVDTDMNGNVFVSDTGNKRILAFTEAGTLLGSFGSYGNGPRQFIENYGLCYDHTSGRVFVADPYNMRLLLVDPLNFSQSGESWYFDRYESYFSGAEDIAVDNTGNVYIYEGGRIIKYDSNGNYLTQWYELNPAYLNDGSMTVDEDGNVYTIAAAGYSTGLGTARHKYDNEGNVLSVTGPWYTGLFDIKAGRDGILHAMTHDFSAIVTMDKQAAVIHVDSCLGLGCFTSGVGGIDMAVSSSGDVCSTYYYDKASVRTATNSLKAYFGGSGTMNGFFNNIGGVAFDSNDLIYIADTDNNRIQVFDGYGYFITKFGEEGTASERANKPDKMAFGPDDSLYVIENYGAKIHKYVKY
jgi:sugar lactone lactonase YvrE